jgi:hypothetical protein
MSFGRNPHVAKAELAEQKALAAGDDAAREMAWREAARLWDRAAEREMSDKRKTEYTQKAEAARRNADGEEAPSDDEPPPPKAAPATPPHSALN